MRAGARSRTTSLGVGAAFGTFVLVACTLGRPPPPAQPPSQRAGVPIHSWAPTSQPAAAPWTGARTRLYTYVLAGDAGSELDAASPARLRARKTLDGLLREVQASQSVDSIDEAALLARANQFVLPARRAGSAPVSAERFAVERFSVEHYDFVLAAGYLNRFRLLLDGAEFAPRLAGHGPFLIAAQKPVGEIVSQAGDGSLVVDRAAAVLLVDLSGSRPEAAPIYVDEFKKAVRTALPQQSENYQPLRAQFASALIRLGEALPFVAEALASTRSLIDPAPTPAARGALQ